MADRPTVLRETVLPWVGVSLLLLDNGKVSIEDPGNPGFEHNDFIWPGERVSTLTQC